MRFSHKLYLQDKKFLCEATGIKPKLLDNLLTGTVEEFLEEATYENEERKELCERVFTNLKNYKYGVHLVTKYIPYDEGNILDMANTHGDVKSYTVEFTYKDRTISAFYDQADLYEGVINRIDHVLQVNSTSYKSCMYLFFNGFGKVVRCFVNDCEVCGDCNKCKVNRDGHLRICPVRRTDCELSKYYAPIGGIIKTVQNACTQYVNRKIIVKEKSGQESVVRVSKVHEAHNDEERFYSLKEYVYKENDRSNYVYKGGKHKSPVAHEKSGYFRKSRLGDHHLIDGVFVPCNKGEGEFTYVESYWVNQNKDDVKVYKTKEVK